MSAIKDLLWLRVAAPHHDAASGRLLGDQVPNRLPQNDLGNGEPGWSRTNDLLIKSQLLYQLSYGPIDDGNCAGT